MTATEAHDVDQFAAARRMTAAMERVVSSQAVAIREAAALVVDAFERDGIIQVFGTGHSRSIALEIAGRAGGLVPANALSIKDLVMYGDTAPGAILDPTVERDPALAQQILDLAETHPADVFVIASNSGVNGSIVGVALRAKELGHPLIAVTSLEHTNAVTPKHPSGKRLSEIADVVIDNRAPYGDTTVGLGDGLAAGAVSSITAAYIAQVLTLGAAERLRAAGEVPPLYVSANVPGGDEHNDALKQRYGSRIGSLA